MSTEDLKTTDDDLIESLQAFGMTIESEVDGSIRPGAATIELQRTRRYRGVAWLAAAVLLVAAGFGLGVVWPDRSGSIDSVGDEADLDQPTPRPTDQAEQDPPESSNPDSTEPESVDPEVQLGSGPSTIEDANGSLLASITTAAALDPREQTESRSEVLTGAVVDELASLDAFKDYDQASLAALLTDGGLKITTTLDPQIHEQAVASIDGLYPNPEGLRFEVGMITIDNRDGSIVDITSSRPGSDALLAFPRPPGSAMKTLVLAALFEDGYQPGDIVRADGPCRFLLEDPNQGPYVVGGSERSTQSIATVTRSSNNCAFVRLGQVVGIDRVITVAADLGIDLPGITPDVASLPLGVAPVDATQLTGAYAALANDGNYRQPWLIASVATADGTVIHRHEANPRQVVSIETAEQISSILASNVELGTGRRAILSDGHDAAGKTGTANDFTDAWFVGYTDYYTASVWLGSPAGGTRIRIPEWNGFGGGLPASIWGRYMDDVHQDLDPVPVAGPIPDVAGQLLTAPNEES